jgi:polyisoprenoid-binding protein YceI
MAAQDAARAPLTLASGRVSIAGTSNIHAYTASSSAVRIARLEIGGAAAWPEILEPGRVAAFDIAVAAASLSSPKEGLDKNMHKALKAQEHPDITFRLLRLEPKTGGDTSAIAVGMLRIAGVEREIKLDLKTAATGSTLTITGSVPLLMTDFGIAPPKAMLGMLKTDPKVTVTVEATFTIPTT